ncbi:MAG: hypothetical protein LBH25_10435 [Fibromonadaceae bacterium]|jgi:hypothetical protein|nr:hypothetical protein [Fibromonadaceae bacterium]
MVTSKSKTVQKAKKASSIKKANGAKAMSAITAITETVQDLLTDFSQVEEVNNTLSSAVRRRLIGAGVRNYGFIDKAYDIARDNPKFLPPFLSAQEIWQDMHSFEEIRQLVMVLEKFLQLATECMMVRGDQCFRDALRVYDSLKEMAKNRVPGAAPLLESLMSFFRKRRRPGEAEPTVKQLEKDFHSLIHGSKDGKIVIENEKPHMVGGKHLIVDKTRSNKGVFKETEEGEIV